MKNTDNGTPARQQVQSEHGAKALSSIGSESHPAVVDSALGEVA